MLRVDIAKAFEGFTLDVAFDAPAAVTAIFGPSGSGKTSIIRAIAGLLPCDRASLTIGDIDLARLPTHKRKVGYVFQDARLFPHLTVLKNLRYGGRHDEEAVISVLGLGPLLDRYPARLSGGEAQRIALGRALMSSPDILLLDEPLSALDGPRKAEVLPYLEALRDQTDIPILYVSHDMTEVARLASRIVVLNQGRVALQGDLEDVLSDPAAAPFLGERDVGAVLSGRIVGHADDGLTKIETQAGALWVPSIVGRAGGHVRLRVPAQDVILSRIAPEGLSALNVLSVTITGLESDMGPSVDVSMRVGDARLLARVTKRSCNAMALRKGDQVFAILKAAAIAPANIG
ncbi:UNVERIFIED_CONTAM: hypothetical protein GTU68_043324 [Idotea baltica]|nr:hypothetical protein [Idotea baltica]